MTEWLFRVSSFASFAADLDSFTGAMGYAPLTDDDGHGGRIIRPGAELQALIRFDFDLIDNMIIVDAVTDADGNVVTPPVMKGPHVNAQATLLPNVDQVAAQTALTTLEGQLAAFFGALPINDYDGGVHHWHATPSGTILIDPPPIKRRRVWA